MNIWKGIYRAVIFIFLSLLVSCAAEGDNEKCELYIFSFNDGFSGVYYSDTGSLLPFESGSHSDESTDLYIDEVFVEEDIDITVVPGVNSTYVSIQLYDGTDLLSEESQSVSGPDDLVVSAFNVADAGFSDGLLVTVRIVSIGDTFSGEYTADGADAVEFESSTGDPSLHLFYSKIEYDQQVEITAYPEDGTESLFIILVKDSEVLAKESAAGSELTDEVNLSYQAESEDTDATETETEIETE